MKVKCTYGFCDVTIVLDEAVDEIFMSREQARDIAKKLVKAADKADEIERNEKYSNIGDKAKAAAYKYYVNCIDQYADRGWDYDHGPFFDMGAEELVRKGKFDGLNKDQLINLLLYLMSLDSKMSLPVACLVSVLQSQGTYSDELLREVLTNKDVYAACEGYDTGLENEDD